MAIFSSVLGFCIIVTLSTRAWSTVVNPNHGVPSAMESCPSDLPIDVTLGPAGQEKRFTDCADAIAAGYQAICYSLGDECCESCPKLIDPYSGKEHCPFGNRMQNITVAGVVTSCEGAITDDTSGLCYQHHKICCETCDKYITDFPKCEFGDGQIDLMLGEPGKEKHFTSCATAIAAGFTAICYSYGDVCCESCPKLIDPYSGMEHCPFGDRMENITVKGVVTSCKKAITDDTSELCYTHHKICCDTCNKYVTDFPTCEFGDRDVKFCKSAITADDASICYNWSRRHKCCDTCRKRKKYGAKKCVYGDWPFRRAYIGGTPYTQCKAAVAKAPGVCYGRAWACCESCAKYKDVSKKNCEYGDRPYQFGLKVGADTYEDCAGAVAQHPGVCYGEKWMCCASCPKVEKKHDVGCEFGDRVGDQVMSPGSNLSKVPCSQAVTADNAHPIRRNCAVAVARSLERFREKCKQVSFENRN